MSPVIDLYSADKALEAVVPVVKVAFDGQISFVGTAFVVSRTGLVITARHVVQDNLRHSGDDIGGIGVLPIYGRFAGVYRCFRHSSWHSIADIALCECTRFRDEKTGQGSTAATSPTILMFCLH